MKPEQHNLGLQDFFRNGGGYDKGQKNIKNNQSLRMESKTDSNKIVNPANMYNLRKESEREKSLS